MGRKPGKVCLNYIRDPKIRKSTFSKRSAGINKKFLELLTLCGIEGCMAIMDSEGNLQRYGNIPSPPPELFFHRTLGTLRTHAPSSSCLHGLELDDSVLQSSSPNDLKLLLHHLNLKLAELSSTTTIPDTPTTTILDTPTTSTTHITTPTTTIPDTPTTHITTPTPSIPAPASPLTNIHHHHNTPPTTSAAPFSPSIDVSDYNLSCPDFHTSTTHTPTPTPSIPAPASSGLPLTIHHHHYTPPTTSAAPFSSTINVSDYVLSCPDFDTPTIPGTPTIIDISDYGLSYPHFDTPTIPDTHTTTTPHVSPEDTLHSPTHTTPAPSAGLPLTIHHNDKVTPATTSADPHFSPIIDVSRYDVPYPDYEFPDLLLHTFPQPLPASCDFYCQEG